VPEAQDSDEYQDQDKGAGMITLTREEAQQVLDDLCGAKLCEINSMSSRVEMLRLIDKAIETLRARLAQPEPPCKNGSQCIGGKCPQCVVSEPKREQRAYTLRKWQGLTDEERTYLAWESKNGPHCVEMTEAMLKEKNR